MNAVWQEAVLIQMGYQLGYSESNCGWGNRRWTDLPYKPIHRESRLTTAPDEQRRKQKEKKGWQHVHCHERDGIYYL